MLHFHQWGWSMKWFCSSTTISLQLPWSVNYHMISDHIILCVKSKRLALQNITLADCIMIYMYCRSNLGYSNKNQTTVYKTYIPALNMKERADRMTNTSWSWSMMHAMNEAVSTMYSLENLTHCQTQGNKANRLGPLLLTRINFNISMDK